MLKVLILDANTDFASRVGRALVNAGHETRIVGDAKYGIVRAKAFLPDLVLMDLNLPGVSGTQLIEEVKPHVSGRIVVCGESTDPEEVKAAITAGASDYVLKSSSIEDIVARACPTEDTGGSEDDSEDGASGEVKQLETKKKLISQLRAPLVDGKRPFCVVIANSDPEKREFVGEIIERINQALHVIEVSTSEEAIAACTGNRTVMLIIDWEIGNIPVRQAIRTVRAHKNSKMTGIFATYKASSPEKQRLALYDGAMAFATEPWDDGSLEAQIMQALTLLRRRRRKARIAIRDARLKTEAEIKAKADAKAEAKAKAEGKSKKARPKKVA